MFERFTDRARRVVVLAQEQARMLDRDYIGTEHLLLGLVHEGEGVAARALASLGIDRDYADQQVIDTFGRGESSPRGHMPFTPEAKRVLERSLREALGLGHSYIGPEHLLLGLIWFADDPAVRQIIVVRADDLGVVRRRVIQLLFGYERPDGELFRDLTALAADPATFGPVVGRQPEVGAVISVLQRDPAVSALLVGERGVGLSTVVCGVAQAIVRPQVPARLAGKRICEFSLPVTQNTARTSQVATELLPTLINDIRDLRDTILFIERSCTPILVRNEWTTVLSLLRPMIVNGDLQAIVTVTPAEQHKYLAPDAEFSRAFDPVIISEISEELAAVVLAELRDRYESRHRVAITDAAITAAVVLSVQHLPDQPLPGKAVELIDKAAARAARRVVDAPFTRVRQRIAELRADKDAAIDDHDYERAGALRQEEKRQLKALDDQQAAWRSEWKNVPAYRTTSVTAQDVAAVITDDEPPHTQLPAR